MTLPAYLTRVLVERGVLTERGTSRRARARVCPGCGAGVVAGLDFDVAALDVDVDPVPLTYAGAVAARLAGIGVYTLSMYGRVQIDYPPGFTPRPRMGVYVVPRHRCGQRVPDAWRASSDARSLPAGGLQGPGSDTPEDPPF